MTSKNIALIGTLDIECFMIIKFLFIQWMFYVHFNPITGIARTCGRCRKCRKSRTDSKEAKTIRNDLTQSFLANNWLALLVTYSFSFFLSNFPFSLPSFVFLCVFLSFFFFLFWIVFTFFLFPLLLSIFVFPLFLPPYCLLFSYLYLFVSFFFMIGTCWTSGSRRTKRNQRRRCKKTRTFNLPENKLPFTCINLTLSYVRVYSRWFSVNL